MAQSKCLHLKPLVLFLSFVLPLLTFSQKNHNIWEALLNNERIEALELVNTLDIKSDIENLFLKKIVQMENGVMHEKDDFLLTISNYEHFENYLFANWKMPYFFSDYYNDGFQINNCIAPHKIDAEYVTNSTVKNGLLYLQAVTKRYQRDWDEYNTLISKIDGITEWEFCGVFENLNSSGIDMPYAPEVDASPKTLFDAQSNGEVKWYKSNNYSEVYNFFTNHSEYGAGVHYAQTFIESDKDQRVFFKLGKGGLFRLWLNDQPILEDDNHYITELDAYTIEVNLQRGVNRVLFKLAADEITPYFIFRIEDLKGQPLKNVNVSLKNRNYAKSNLEAINPIIKPHNIERFFENKLKDNTGDSNLNTFCLYLTYSRNGRLEKALEVLNQWSKQYPKSSFVKSCLISCYNTMNDFSNAEKLQDNMGRLDPDYYLSLLQKFQNTDALMKLDIETYESTLKKISTSMDYSYMEASCDFMISIRQNDKEAMKKQLDALLNDPTLPSSIIPTFAGIYSQLFNDDYITITKLEAFNKSYYNWGIITSLAYYYKKQNRIEDAIQLFTESIEKFGDDNNVLYEVILLLHELGDYKRSLPFIDQAIGNFPNSYAFAKFKADAYVQLGKKAEALRLYELAISRNPSASDLRSKINDLKNSKNPLDDFHLNNPYDYISKNRNTVENNNYGLNKLLYQTDILGYDTGGGEYKITMIYEITSQNGLDVFKEYDLDLSGDYLIYKSESVKPDGTTVPADRDGSNLVFDELEIGDVVLIDYEVKYSRSGRFYKDEVLSHSFGGYHPGLIDIYRFISKRENIDYKVTNGELNYKKYKKGELFVNEWSLSNFKGLPLSEDFMPPFSDVTPRLSISTISSWQEIADWYSDLVRKQLKVDGVVEDTFHSIFPQGIEGLSETERAKKIYYYIINNMNYSYVSFRQSGYVPQKPSKTLKTKLGDCKDFSSLFLVLAHKAGLSANLVLILTSDYGKKELVMPSTDFNHCIVKVTVDGKNQYLELTNKYLPFESLPMSLREASALEIPFEKTEKQKATLIYLTNVSREPAVFQSSYVMNLKGDESTIDLKTSVSGHMASYFIETYKTKEDKLLDETILEEISSRASEPVKLKKLKDINYNKDLGIISVETELTSKIKINKIGKLNAFKIPYFLNPYNNAIIQSEQRNFPIDYKAYENTDVYEETMLIILEDNEIIEDIPENVTLSFKSHTFSLEYAVPKPNNLKVEIKCNMGTTDISVLEYEEFKTYVSKYLETKDVMVTFRKTEKS